MADLQPNAVSRLDSWKAIASYLKRDESTVRRWERELGLPVRRVNGGRGASVFAFASELDAWLLTQQPAAATALSARRPRTWSFVGVAAGVASLCAAGWWLTWGAVLPAQVDVTQTAVIARNAEGRERWRYVFPSDERVAVDTVTRNLAEIVSGRSSGVLVGAGLRIHIPTSASRTGQLLLLSPRGSLSRLLSLDDTVRFPDASYEPPWALIDFRVHTTPERRRIALAAHHYTWWPGMITVLDEDWNRVGTFINAGWTERVHWVDDRRLLASGFSQSRDAGMVALLDADALDGASPEDPGGRFACQSCGHDRPLRYVVMPRSEVNRATGSQFNRARIDIQGDHILVRTMEVPAHETGAAEAVYEFTPALDLVSAEYGSRYWELHRTLELEEKLDHSREQCPDRHGPRQLLVWQPADGWQTISTLNSIELK